VGDPQVDNEVELGYARKSIYAELRQRKDLDLIIVMGDLVNEKPELIAPSEASLDSIGVPWLRLNGNHDGPNPVKDTCFERGGVRFILMDNVRRGGRKGYEGGFSESQKAWLQACTKGHEKTVLCTHIPLSWCKGGDSLSMALNGRKDILLVSAHTHRVERRETENGIELGVGATCGSWWRGRKDSRGVPDAMMGCGSPRGYFIADFAPTKAQWYTLAYKCVDRPKNEQISIHADSSNLVINVYGGAAFGKVQAKIDGKWVDAVHSNRIAPEAQKVIEYNSSLTRAERKALGSDYLPVLNSKSLHIWVVPAVDTKKLKNRQIRIKYDDGAMKFKTKGAISC